MSDKPTARIPAIRLLAQGIRSRLEAGLPFREEERSFLAQQQVHNPTAPDMWPRPAAVTEDVGVGATGLFQGVGQDRQAVEGSLVVDRLGQPGNRAVIPGQPRW